MTNVKKYEGKEADVTWDKRLCIHIGECGRANNDLFDGSRDPWCSPDEVALYQVVEVIERCPSGALAYQRKDGGPDEAAEQENVVVVANNGPLYLRGDLDVDGAPDDAPGLRFRAALCRCGLSKNKPFCDNSHEKGGFVDRGAVGESTEGSEESGGTLDVTFAENGPILIRGNVTLVAGSGRKAWSGTKCALCRCGQSSNKPFCDGSHKTTGFVSG